jgi:hypothetical protein
VTVLLWLAILVLGPLAVLVVANLRKQRCQSGDCTRHATHLWNGMYICKDHAERIKDA